MKKNSIDSKFSGWFFIKQFNSESISILVYWISKSKTMELRNAAYTHEYSRKLQEFWYIFCNFWITESHFIGFSNFPIYPMLIKSPILNRASCQKWCSKILILVRHFVIAIDEGFREYQRDTKFIEGRAFQGDGCQGVRILKGHASVEHMVLLIRSKWAQLF